MWEGAGGPPKDALDRPIFAIGLSQPKKWRRGLYRPSMKSAAVALRGLGEGFGRRQD